MASVRSDLAYPWLGKLKVHSDIVRESIAEFLGTFILIVIGDAAFAQAVLDGKGTPDVFAICWAWGIAVTFGIAASANVSGGHINPAITLSLATLRKFPWRKVPAYIIAQHLGGFVAAFVVYANYIDALNHYDPDRTVEGKTATAFVWATYPKSYVSWLNLVLDQVVGTGLLMFCIMAAIDKKNLNIPKWMQPFLIGSLVSAIALSFGLNSMSALNPARDFPPRVFTAMAGWGSETFSLRGYNYWWIGIVGPHIGACLGAWLYYLGVELHWPSPQEPEMEMKELILRDGKPNQSEDADHA